MRALSWFPIAAALVASPLMACNKPLDEDQCTQLVDKMVDLAAADEPAGPGTDKLKTDVKGDRRTVQNVKDTCVGKMTKSQYECVMGAKTFKDASACDGK